MMSSLSGAVPESAVSDSSGRMRSRLWSFVGLEHYVVPSLPVRSGPARIWKALTGGFKAQEAEEGEPVGGLEPLSEEELDRVAPLTEWDGAARSLAKTLEDGGDSPAFVVGAPFSGRTRWLRRWACLKGAVIVAPPEPGAILGGGASWLDDWPRDRLWVMAGLERVFLRHRKGLDLVRLFLDRARQGCLGVGVIGCGSWAWAYLRQVAPVGPRAWTLQAFDGEALRDFFAALASRPHLPLRFLRARTGQELFSVPQGDDSVPQELRQLARECRGNAGLALNLWRNRLRTAGDGLDRAYRVTDAFSPPSLPGGEETDLLLHALLLHGHLDRFLLADLLPLAEHRLTALFLDLRARSVIEEKEGHLSVTASAYGPVRERLSGLGYLVDAF